MHNDGPCMRQTFLSLVDLVQEAENTPRFTGNPMVRPAQVLVVPYLPNKVPLGQGQRGNACCFHTISLSLSSPPPHRLENKSRKGSRMCKAWGHSHCPVGRSVMFEVCILLCHVLYSWSQSRAHRHAECPPPANMGRICSEKRAGKDKVQRRGSGVLLCPKT